MKEITPASPGTKPARARKKSASGFSVTICTSQNVEASYLELKFSRILTLCFVSETQNHVLGKPDHYRDGGADPADVRSHRRPDTQHHVELWYTRLSRGRTGILPFLLSILKEFSLRPSARVVVFHLYLKYMQYTEVGAAFSCFTHKICFCLQEHQKRIYQV